MTPDDTTPAVRNLTEIVIAAQPAEPSVRYEQARNLIAAAAPLIAAQIAAAERERNGRQLERILVSNVVLPEATADLIYGLMHDLLAQEIPPTTTEETR